MVALVVGAIWWLVLIFFGLGTQLPLLLLGIFTILFVYLWATTPKPRETLQSSASEIKIMIICSNCGTTYNASKKKCPNCGRSIS